jgi:Flp pilus assembly protein TadG
MNRMRPRGRPKSGQTLAEFALVLPMLLILIANVVNFGGFFFDWITVQNAARSGAQYYILGGASVNAPKQATPAQVATLVYNDMVTLLKSTNYSGQVCTKTPSGPGVPGVTTVVSCTAIGAAGAFPPAPPDDPSLCRTP